MKRYRLKTGYHYWVVFDNEKGKNVCSYSARTYGGDAEAKDKARDHVERLNSNARSH